MFGGADTLSQKPLRKLCHSEMEDEAKAHVEAVITSKEVLQSKLDAIREATEEDADLQAVMSFLSKVWPKYIPFQLGGYC